jgi:WD40 repeat protein
MYHRGLNWEKYLDRYNYREESGGGLARQSVPPITLGACSGTVISKADLTAAIEKNLCATIPPSDFRSVTPESLKASFDWGLGSLLWKLEHLRNTLPELVGQIRSGNRLDLMELIGKGEHAYQANRYTEALTALTSAAERAPQDFSLQMTLGHIYLYHQRPTDPNKARSAYINAAAAVSRRSPAFAARAALWAAFAAYLLREDQDALELAQGCAEFNTSWGEIQFSQARYLALTGDAGASLAALEQAIFIDRNYALRAVICPDFTAIEQDMAAVFDRMRLEARQQADTQGRTLHTRMQASPVPFTDQPTTQRMQAEIAERWKQDTYFGYIDTSGKMMRLRLFLDGLQLEDRDRLMAEARTTLGEFREKIAAAPLPAALEARLKPYLECADASLAAVPDKKQSETILEELHLAEQIWKVGTNQTVLEGHTGDVSPVSFSPDGQFLATSGSWDRSIRLWSAASAENTTVLNGHHENVTILAFSPDSTLLASACSVYKGQDFTIRLWNPRTGRSQAVLDGHTNMVTGLAFDPAGARLASTSGDTAILLWNTADAEKICQLGTHKQAATCLAWQPQGSLLISGGEDQAIRIWDTGKREQVAVLLGHNAAITQLIVCPDGKTLISLSEDFTIRLWDIQKHQLLRILEMPEQITALALSPDGAYLTWSTGKDGILRLWKVLSESEPRKILGHLGRITSLSFCKCADILASGGEDGVVRIWNYQEGRCLAIRKGHTRPVIALDFSPDGVLLASGSRDKTARLWGMVITPADTAAVQQEIDERARLQAEEERQQAAAAEQQKEAWRAEGRCEVCGTKLSLVDRIAKEKRCKDHR